LQTKYDSSFSRGKDMFLPSLLYSLSTYISLNCLDGVTMPLFPFIQRLCPLVIIAIHFYVLRRKRPTVQSVLMIALSAFGSGMASKCREISNSRERQIDGSLAFHELNLDPWHLLYSLISLLMFAFSLVSVERLREQYSSPLELIYMNTFNCLCLFLIADLVQVGVVSIGLKQSIGRS